MKRVVRCRECASGAYRLGTGFVNNVTWYCTERGCEVDKDDGCTFGCRGEPKPAVSNYDVCMRTTPL